MEVITLIFGTAASFTGIAALYYGFLVFTGYRKIRKSKELSTENEEELYPLVTYRDNLKKEIALLSDKEKVLRETKQLEKDRAAIQKAIDDMDTLKEAGERATRFMERMQYGESGDKDTKALVKNKQLKYMSYEERGEEIRKSGRKPIQINITKEKQEYLRWINHLLRVSRYKDLSRVKIVVGEIKIMARTSDNFATTLPLGCVNPEEIFNVNKITIKENYLWAHVTTDKSYSYGKYFTRNLSIPIADLEEVEVVDGLLGEQFNIYNYNKLNLWVDIMETKDELASVEDIALIREHEKKKEVEIKYRNFPKRENFRVSSFCNKIHSNNTFRVNQEDLYKTKVVKSSNPPQFLERFLRNEYNNKGQPRFYQDILNYALYDGDWSLNSKYGTVWTRTPLYLFNRSQIDFLLKGKTVPSMRAKEVNKTIIKYPKGYHYITQLGYNEGIFWVCIRETLSPTKEVWIPIELLLKLSKTDLHFTTERR